MPKKGFLINNLDPVLASNHGKEGWSLCIGAGTSMPIFPSWYSLAEQLASALVPDKPFNINTLQSAGFSADTMIQMVKNYSGLDDLAFAQHMSKVLYTNLRAKVDDKDWPIVSKVLEADQIPNCTMSQWKIFSSYRDSLFQSTSANQIAEVILTAIEKDNAPQNILSFNAEPLLFSLLNSYIVGNNKTCPPKMFSKVVSSVSNIKAGTIPYIYCHGLLPITNQAHVFSTSVDKLVFLEEEYLHLANNAFSWQSATFLSVCSSQHIVFIGTSLTDPNMRRWLSWTHSNRLEEMRENGINVTDSTQHYWIRTTPADQADIPWIESAVSHLGVRIIWIEDWNQVGLALKKILGLMPKQPVSKPKRKKERTPKRKYYKSHRKH